MSIAEQKRGKGRWYKVTYRRKGWGNTEFVKLYEHESHGPENVLSSFIRENLLNKEEVVRIEEIVDRSGHK